MVREDNIGSAQPNRLIRGLLRQELQEVMAGNRDTYEECALRLPVIGVS